MLWRHTNLWQSNSSVSDPNFRQFRQAWQDGKLVILGTLAEGPNAGGNVVCVTPRDGFVRGIKRCRAYRSDRGFIDSVRSAIRSEVLRGLDRLNPTNAKNLMDDLTIMMALKLNAGESVLDGSGLFSLALLVDQDGTRPWNQRGFVRERDVRCQAP